ncbi:hypothetical protein T4B_10152 [Trichinella pseudospiralis]|uniref:Uncharacterized protein n=1 Tax=Trichinella pseudospiralis TaxID=6337 RepID=A0A0V1KF62_TRIPS|nr:hypothetical protein T4B_10152 [Trichinella pseudospiralis]KRZ45863.1 hypothetical protein T4C_4903 [Trichinella pseudospiralis]
MLKRDGPVRAKFSALLSIRSYMKCDINYNSKQQPANNNNNKQHVSDRHSKVEMTKTEKN